MRPARLVLLYASFLWSFAAVALEEPTAELTEPMPEPLPAVTFSYIELLPQASIITPGTLILQNELYRVPHSESLTGMPSIGLGIAIPLATLGQFQFFAQAQAAYRYKQGSLSIRNTHGEILPDTVTLHWIPLSGSIKTTFEIPDFSYAKPTLTVGAGTQWLSQSGRLPGLSGSFWVPYAFISPALTFLEARTVNDWFGGFSFGTTIYRALTVEQQVQGLSLDLTVNILL